MKQKMNKINKKEAIFAALLIIVLLIWMGSFVLADDTPQIVPAVTLSTLGVTNVGLLPSNPFYFSEEWMNTIQKIFATNPVSQSQLELQILNNKAAELLASSQLTPADPSALDTAINTYGNELQTMSSDISNINVKDSQTDSFFGALVAKLYLHYELLEQIEVQYGGDNGNVAAIQNQIEQIVDQVPVELTNSSNFQNILTNALGAQTDLGSQLRALPFLDALQENNSSQSVQSEIDQVRQSEVFGFEGRYDADGLSTDVIPGILSQLPVSNVSQIMLVGDLGSFVVDSNLSSYLNNLDSQLLVQASTSDELANSDVSSLDAYGETLLADIGTSDKTDEKTLESASSSLAQAKTDLANGLAGQAFAETQAATYSLDAILFTANGSTANSTSSVASLSNQLSAFENEAIAQGLSNVNDPKLFSLFNTTYSIVANNPSVSEVYQAEESLDEITFALGNAANGLSSALIPVPGEASLSNNTNLVPDFSTTSDSGIPQYCPEVYEPVCGVNDETYSNQCFENLAAVTTFSRGQCAPVTSTTTTSTPQTSN